jgi:nucleotide-binding universal stress UspA family protein
MYERIVVPLDGSDLAERAMATAEGLSRALGAPLHLVRVVDYFSTTFNHIYGGMVESEAIAMQVEHERTMAQAYLEDVAGSLQHRGLEVTTEVRHGVPVQELCDSVQQGDVLVIASHGRSGVARWFLGSVAEEMTRRATVPVLLVRAGTMRNGPRPGQYSAVSA